ncbi:MAG TPA: hypothetical protein GXX51_03390 [Firmicutes bacterium]|nr:hypothetical protein [Bacillota bacterium]
MTQGGRKKGEAGVREAEIRNRDKVDKARFLGSKRLEGMREDPMNSDVTLVRVDAADGDEVTAANAWSIMDPVEMPEAKRLEEIAGEINEGTRKKKSRS